MTRLFWRLNWGLTLALMAAPGIGCGGDDDSDSSSDAAEETGTSGDGDGDGGDGDGDSGDGDGDSGDGDGDSGDGDGDSGDGDGEGVDCTILDGEACDAEPSCESVFGAAYEPWMDGWCISDAFEFLGCVAIADVCDYSGPSCSPDFPGVVYEVFGCPPGFEPCEAPMPVTEGCGG